MMWQWARSFTPHLKIALMAMGMILTGYYIYQMVTFIAPMTDAFAQR
jgi:hypothetical protein